MKYYSINCSLESIIETKERCGFMCVGKRSN
jgi:hypothetical protein